MEDTVSLDFKTKEVINNSCWRWEGHTGELGGGVGSKWGSLPFSFLKAYMILESTSEILKQGSRALFDPSIILKEWMISRAPAILFCACLWKPH